MSENRHTWKYKTVIADVSSKPRTPNNREGKLELLKYVEEVTAPAAHAGWELINVTPINLGGTTMWLLYTFKMNAE